MQAAHISGINIAAFMARAGQDMIKVQNILGKDIMPAAYEALAASMRDLTSPLTTGLTDKMPSLPSASVTLSEAHHGVSAAVTKDTGKQIG